MAVARLTRIVHCAKDMCGVVRHFTWRRLLSDSSAVIWTFEQMNITGKTKEWPRSHHASLKVKHILLFSFVPSVLASCKFRLQAWSRPTVRTYLFNFLPFQDGSWPYRVAVHSQTGWSLTLELNLSDESLSDLKIDGDRVRGVPFCLNHHSGAKPSLNHLSCFTQKKLRGPSSPLCPAHPPKSPSISDWTYRTSRKPPLQSRRGDKACSVVKQSNQTETGRSWHLNCRWVRGLILNSSASFCTPHLHVWLQ